MAEGFEIAIVFLGMASLVALPLAVLLGLPLAAWLGRAWIRLQERRVDLEQLEVVARLRETHAGRLPHWVDTSDPDALLAWARADRELARLERIA